MKRIDKISRLIDDYKPHRDYILSRKCLACKNKNGDLYYYKEGLRLLCNDCFKKYPSKGFKLTVKERFFLEISL